MPYAIRLHARCPNCGEDLDRWDPPEEAPAPLDAGLRLPQALRDAIDEHLCDGDCSLRDAIEETT